MFFSGSLLVAIRTPSSTGCWGFASLTVLRERTYFSVKSRNKRSITTRPVVDVTDPN